MNWLSRQLSKYKCGPLNNYQYLAYSLGRVFVIVVLSNSSIALAEPVDIAPESNPLNWLDDDSAIVEDANLSSISGKGVEATTLENDSKLAIILWDEGRQGNKGGTNHAMSSPSVITLTVIQK